MSDTLVLYIMGAGRSGTTILATLLGLAPDYVAAGELNQLPQHVRGEKVCGCGAPLERCVHWAPLVSRLEPVGRQEFERAATRYERHGSIWRYCASSQFSRVPQYQRPTLSALRAIGGGDRVVVDSSKYIGRAVALTRITGLDVKILYVVRDPRGVAGSFAKRVQTRRPPASAAFYYMLVNATAEIVSRVLLRERVLKIHYEDLVADPLVTLDRIEAFVGRSLEVPKAVIRRGQDVPVGHLVGGNRIRSERTVAFRRQAARPELSRTTQLGVWLATLPLNVINRYRL